MRKILFDDIKLFKTYEIYPLFFTQGDLKVKKLIQFVTASVLLIAVAQKANASILIEPVVGYTLSSNFVSDKADLDANGTGLSYGGRLGWQNLGLQVGLDYLSSSIDLDDKDVKDPLAMSEFAAFVGYEFPLFLRAYAGYIFSATAETKATNGTKAEFSEGSGMKAGLGFSLLAMLDVNLEYRKGSFGELAYNGTDSGFETDYSAYMLSFSLPFNI